MRPRGAGDVVDADDPTPARRPAPTRPATVRAISAVLPPPFLAGKARGAGGLAARPGRGRRGIPPELRGGGGRLAGTLRRPDRPGRGRERLRHRGPGEDGAIPRPPRGEALESLDRQGRGLGRLAGYPGRDPRRDGLGPGPVDPGRVVPRRDGDGLRGRPALRDGNPPRDRRGDARPCRGAPGDRPPNHPGGGRDDPLLEPGPDSRPPAGRIARLGRRLDARSRRLRPLGSVRPPGDCARCRPGLGLCQLSRLGPPRRRLSRRPRGDPIRHGPRRGERGRTVPAGPREDLAPSGNEDEPRSLRGIREEHRPALGPREPRHHQLVAIEPRGHRPGTTGLAPAPPPVPADREIDGDGPTRPGRAGAPHPRDLATAGRPRAAVSGRSGWGLGGHPRDVPHGQAIRSGRGDLAPPDRDRPPPPGRGARHGLGRRRPSGARGSARPSPTSTACPPCRRSPTPSRSSTPRSTRSWTCRVPSSARRSAPSSAPRITRTASRLLGNRPSRRSSSI